MSSPPLPVVFEPILKPKPWGGRRLATLLNKALPENEPIGESWELVDLPGNESRVRHGPLAGQTLGELARMWGTDLLGDADLVGGRFPLVIKFLDARENLSIQVHPKPAESLPQKGTGIKHEAWYVIHADPGAKLYIGLKPGVGPDDVARAANTPAIVDLLGTWDARAGDCYYLPSGTPHALGAGIVVAEIQTPSDITYRLYDWNRPGLDGRLRELHIEQALANMRYDLAPEQIVQAPKWHPTELYSVLRLAACDRFRIDRVRLHAGWAVEIPGGQPRIWIIRAGSGLVHVRGFDASHDCRIGPGDVVLIPAASDPIEFQLDDDADFLEVTIPG